MGKGKKEHKHRESKKKQLIILKKYFKKERKENQLEKTKQNKTLKVGLF